MFILCDMIRAIFNPFAKRQTSLPDTKMHPKNTIFSCRCLKR